VLTLIKIVYDNQKVLNTIKSSLKIVRDLYKTSLPENLFILARRMNVCRASAARSYNLNEVHNKTFSKRVAYIIFSNFDQKAVKTIF